MVEEKRIWESQYIPKEAQTSESNSSNSLPSLITKIHSLISDSVFHILNLSTVKYDLEKFLKIQFKKWNIDNMISLLWIEMLFFLLVLTQASHSNF